MIMGIQKYINLITPFQRWWLLGLLLLWAGFLFGGFAFGTIDAEATHRMPTWTRIASSVILVVAGWSWYRFTRDTVCHQFALFIAIGMTFGLLGDVFMAGLLPVSDYLLWGMGTFGLGHVAYINAFVRFGNQTKLNAKKPRWGAWAVWLLIGLLGWYFVVMSGRHRGLEQPPTALRWAALPYALLLASTTASVTGLALQAPAFVFAAVGSALFLSSDLILAAQLFNNTHFHLIGDVVWFTYGLAQALLVYAVISALQITSLTFRSPARNEQL